MTNERPPTSTAIDWTMALLCGWFVVGFFVDAYAHHNGAPESFFTPWHGLLYSGFLASAGYTAWLAWRGRRAGYPWRRALPLGYGATAVGALAFMAGGLGDMAWHTVFGIEADVEALFSPTHLMLGLGGVMMAAGPLRAAWLRPGDLVGSPWRRCGPTVLSLLWVLSALTFFIQYAHPLTEPQAQIGDVSGPRALLYVVDADGMGQARLSLGRLVDDSTPAVAADGRLAFASADADGRYALVVAAPDGTDRRVVWADPDADLLQPDWSPAGDALLVLRDDPAGPAIWRVAPTEGGQREVVVDTGGPVLRPRYAPDGVRLAFGGRANGTGRIGVVDGPGAAPRWVTPPTLDAGDPDWSPDGASLIFGADDGHGSSLYTVGADGEGLAPFSLPDAASYAHADAAAPVGNSHDGASDRPEAWSPRWSPDGRRVAYVGTRDGDVDVFVADPGAGTVANVSARADTNDAFAAWTPDGRVVFRARPNGGGGDYANQAVGTLGILVVAALMTGVVLLVVVRWTLPTGTLLTLLALNGLAMAALEDRWNMVGIAIAGGLAAEVLYRALRPSRARVAALRTFAFGLPLVVFLVYHVGLMVTERLTWSIHLWTGSAVMAGFVGVLLSFLVTGFVDPDAR